MDAVGLEFHPVRPDMPSYDDTEEMIKLSAELMDPRGGTEKVMELFTANPREVYEDLDAGG